MGLPGQFSVTFNTVFSGSKFEARFQQKVDFPSRYAHQ
jgi:hypothetical protein